MEVQEAVRELTYQERIQILHDQKLRDTKEKQDIIGSMDHDDWAQVLPPPDRRLVTEAISGSGERIVDVLLDGVEIETNYPDGGFFGPRYVGRNFRHLLDAHPPYVDPVASIAGAYMANYNSYIKVGWNPDFSYDHLIPAIKKYDLRAGIGGKQHFCQDLQIGFDLGWGGIRDKIRKYRELNAPDGAEFYEGLEEVVLGMQSWIGRTAAACREMAETEQNPQFRKNLLEMAEMNERLVNEPPKTFRDAVQWLTWYDMAARMFNGSGSLGRLDVLLTPFYERDTAAGILTDEEAKFHIACSLLRDTGYMQLGGPDFSGKDVTNKVSYLALEAAHEMGIPANVGIAVGENVDEGLLKRGVEIQFDDKKGMPKFLAVEQTAKGFARNGYDIGWGYERAYSGCHWSAIPGREYTMNDIIKISCAKIFDVAMREMMTDKTVEPSLDRLWELYEFHQLQAVKTIGQALDFHLAHMADVMPELVMDLLCHGTIEQGLDASAGGVEFYNMCCDATGIATVADSFAALDQRVVREKRITWQELWGHLENNWAGPEGERVRQMMKHSQRYGQGGSLGDEWAVKICQSFTDCVRANPTPEGRLIIPGIFSWAQTIGLGKVVMATPNGRFAGEPVSHGASPDPGFRQDGAPSAMAVAVASVQPGFGNTAPMQLDFDPGIRKDEGGVEKVADLIKTHFRLGGTQINMNVMDKETVLKAHEDPSKYPDLVVRVTGFSAYFASLSKEFRQLVVDRIIAEG